MSNEAVTILYFAWMREHTGVAEEDLALPDGVTSIGELLPHLISRSPGHATALGNMMTVRVAVNRTYGDLKTAITGGDEIAFFPPVTGG